MSSPLGAVYERIHRTLPAPVRNVVELFWMRSSVLNTNGWIRSRKEQMCIGPSGEPIPWYTYPAIRFLEPRVSSDLRVFEFGIGNSTLWWSRRVAKVEACENDASWFDRIMAKAPSNVTVTLTELEGDDYVTAASRGEHDVIVIDGFRRAECVKNSLGAISHRGVFIWDNSDRDTEREGYKFLTDNGFKRLDFWGAGPLNAFEWCTSVFYRPDNCIGI